MRYRKMKIVLSVGAVIVLGIFFQIRSFNAENRNKLDSETDYSVSLSNSTAYGNELETTQEYVYLNEPKEKQQSYESFYDFPYSSGIEFADLYLYDIIKKEYNNINFQGVFKKGDSDDNSVYLEGYQKLLTNEVTFFDKMQEKDLHFMDLEFIDFFVKDRNYDLKDFSYIFYDMDEDGTPELCVSDGTVSGYIFKYIPEKEQYILWHKWESSYYGLLGTKKMYWDHNGDSHAFYKLDKNAEVECKVYFHRYYLTSTENGQSETIYMVSLPSYVDRYLEINEEISIKSYFDENLQVHYFRVSESQFEELTHNYFEAISMGQEKIKEVTYTYDELFNVTFRNH